MKLRCLIVITVVLVAFGGVHSASSGNKGVFLNRYNVDVEQIIQSKRLLINYANCILEKGPCTNEGKELRAQIPEAIRTECAKCSDEEKKQVGIIFSHLLQYHRDLWNELMTKYDVQGDFRKKYEITDEDYDYEEDQAKDK